MENGELEDPGGNIKILLEDSGKFLKVFEHTWEIIFMLQYFFAIFFCKKIHIFLQKKKLLLFFSKKKKNVGRIVWVQRF